MTAYLAGLAIIRCAEHDKADAFTPAARLVLVAMGSFAGDEDAPEFRGSVETIAERAGLGRTVTKEGRDLLAAMGAIERGPKVGKTYRWRLVMLYPREVYEASACGRNPTTRAKETSPVQSSGQTRPSGRHTTTRTGRHTTTRTGRNPTTILPSPPESQTREDDDRTTLTADADGRPSMDRTRGLSGALLDELAELLGLDDRAEVNAWAAEVLANANGTVRQRAPYLRRAAANDRADEVPKRPKPASPKPKTEQAAPKEAPRCVRCRRADGVKTIKDKQGKGWPFCGLCAGKIEKGEPMWPCEECKRKEAGGYFTGRGEPHPGGSTPRRWMYCLACARRLREQAAEDRARVERERGLCVTCKTEPVATEGALCPSCAEARKREIAAARKRLLAESNRRAYEEANAYLVQKRRAGRS